MVGVLPSRTRFFDLGPQCKVEAFQPIAGIWKTDILCQIVCQLVTNKLGMNYEKRGRQECPAHFIIATEKVFRQQKDGGAKDEPERKPNLLPRPTTPPKQGNDWRQYQKRSQTKTRFDRSEKDCGRWCDQIRHRLISGERARDSPRYRDRQLDRVGA